jgi:hypothetical protein
MLHKRSSRAKRLIDPIAAQNKIRTLARLLFVVAEPEKWNGGSEAQPVEIENLCG